MNRIILLASLALGGILTAQQDKGKQLSLRLQEQQESVALQKEFFEQKLFGYQEDTLEKTEISEALKNYRKFYLENRDKIAFFIQGKPVFLRSNDTDQNQSSNIDAIQNGELAGLSGNFLGEGIHITVFDGGKAQETHDVFQENGTSRVNNKETDPNVLYDDHATAVTSMIGSKDNPITFTQNRRQISGNTRGVLPKATFDNYAYRTSEINGRSRNIMGKIIDAQPLLSNHSYGLTAGWSDGMYFGYYDKDLLQGFDLLGSYGIYDFYYDFIVHSNPKMVMVKAAGNAYGNASTSSVLNYFYDTQLDTDDDDERMGGMFDFDLNTFQFTSYPPPPANCAEGYDCIESGSLGKNVIIVGATEKIDGNIYTQSSDVVKASYSNAGPRDDGAIKPDISAVGSNIISASYNRRIANHYEQGSGTSYSTPHITGIIGLWQEINQTLFNGENLDGASAKNLLIHTAQEAGNIGPDVWYGWGFANAKAGAELLLNKANNNVIFENKSLENNDKHELYLESDGTQPLKVSITWIDPPYYRPYNDLTWQEIHNYRTSTLVNDLDLRITNIATGEVFYPWKLDADNPMNPALKGDNRVDNVEQVLIDAPEKGTYKVEISHKGTLTEFDLGENSTPIYTPAPQEYSIIATGYNRLIANNIIDDNTGFNIYPTLINNDMDKIVNISYNQKKISSISVYDMAGRLLKTEEVNANFHQINFSDLKDGIYIVDIKLASSKETITRKVLKR